MNKKGLALFLRARVRPPHPPLPPNQGRYPDSPPSQSLPLPNSNMDPSLSNHHRANNISPSLMLKDVKDWMHASMSIPAHKIEPVDTNLENFLQGYLGLAQEDRRELILVLAKDYDVNRTRVRDLMQQYLSLEPPHALNDGHSSGPEEEGILSAFYRTERNLRDAIKPMYALFFERLNAYPGGLKLLVVLRADLLAILAKENIPSLRALDSFLKEKLITWLSPASLGLHHITWDDSASLLEKIVAYEAVHPIKNLLDLKRRLGVGRRCFGYMHPAIYGEPLIFIEVALLKDVAVSIQDVLWDEPPTPECEASCALFYSITSTQPGLAGINLGKFLIKRVIELIRREMPHITTFATLSPIPGFMQWLLSKLASQFKIGKTETEDASTLSHMGFGSVFRENILLPEEEKMIVDSSVGYAVGNSGLEIMKNLLASTNNEWIKSDCLLKALKPPLLRLCARYLLKERKRGKALDPVANFHLQNGAMIERINWMADQSEKGLQQSAGLMVNYVYRLDHIEEYAELFINEGRIHASPALQQYVNDNL
ncbi:malonyl-CoA decarboxylase, mitochondrial isoform X2 [Dioscorea cayenensis subsp. rotundata]|uniref:Malonyl-CoA decarboxylase, mitochondrial isoform X2 n=1 Tax=Dioscorea cayennensis subsp. rotundata TaxID=55577 RepID=A0AB40BUJ1_DIOCR|nr:malonyl-CoA decarboxylase, mitochondrial isoform X2 [Dioscorea cayenensis subsp. rotundata]